MTTITEGMTPAEFIVALNANFAEIKFNAQSITTILAAHGFSQINTNFTTINDVIPQPPIPSVSSIVAGMSGSSFANSINQNFVILKNAPLNLMRDFSGLTRYAGNPIIPPGVYSWGTVTQIDPPYVRYENKIGNTWYAPLQATETPGEFNHIALFVSTDLITWVEHPVNPIIITNTPGNWDDHFLMHPSVIKVGDLWYMYYGGMTSTNWHQIGLATSPDFINWTKYGSSPIFTKAQNNGNHGDIPCVIKIGNIYYMYYMSWLVDYSVATICYATSSDGLIWTYGGICLKTNPSDWTIGHGIIDTWVIQRSDGLYEMTFSTSHIVGDPQRIGYALSYDAIHWWMKNSVVLAPTGIPGDWDSQYIGDDVLLEKPDGTTYLYYAGVADDSRAGGGLVIL